MNPIDWTSVKKVLVIRLRSIGDTVLSTPSLIALRRFLPDSKIDILLEPWVAPVLDGFDAVDEVLTVGRSAGERLNAAREIRRRGYDVVFDLHGGSTASLLARATGARHRVGYSYYRYASLFNHVLSSSSEFWDQEKTHSAEQQLALLGSVGIPVDDRPRTRLAVSETGRTARVREWTDRRGYALIHPSTAFFTKQWPVESFARTAEFLAAKGVNTVAVASRAESEVLKQLKTAAKSRIATFDDLSLPEITALASGATVFVGNDSGIAHIAAAVGTPTVVIFGSSNRAHWRPWTDAPNEIVFTEFECQPCPGYRCEVYGEPRCILSVPVASVTSAVERVLA